VATVPVRQRVMQAQDAQPFPIPPPPPPLPRSRLPDIRNRFNRDTYSAPPEYPTEDPIFQGHSKLYQRRKEIETQLRQEFNLPEEAENVLLKDGVSPGARFHRGPAMFGRPPPVPKPRRAMQHLPPIPRLVSETPRRRWGIFEEAAGEWGAGRAAEASSSPRGEKWWRLEQEELSRRRCRSPGPKMSDAAGPTSATAARTPPPPPPPPVHLPCWAGAPAEQEARERPQSWRQGREGEALPVAPPVLEKAKELEELARERRQRREEERRRAAAAAQRDASRAEAQKNEEEDRHSRRRAAEQHAQELRAREQQRFEEMQRKEARHLRRETEEMQRRRKEQEDWEKDIRRRFEEEEKQRRVLQQMEAEAEMKRMQSEKAKFDKDRELREERLREEGDRAEEAREARRAEAARQRRRMEESFAGPPRGTASRRAASLPASGARPDGKPSLEVAGSLKHAEAAAMQQLKQLQQLPRGEERQKAFKDLLRAWHPDKNPQSVEVATAVFQRLQAERKRVLDSV